jgi:hypothetical protein
MSDSESDVEVSLSVGEAAVRKWCHAKRLSDKTAHTIINLGYDSMEALSLVTEEDLGETLPVGQKRLLLQQIKKTFPQGAAAVGLAEPQQAEAEVTGGAINPMTAETDEDVFMRGVLGQLSSTGGVGLTAGSQQGMPSIPAPVSGMHSWQDPQIYLKSLNSGGPKDFYDIVDFVNTGSTTTERVLSNNSDGQLVFKSGPSKPKLENITVPQWSVANLAIMQKLLQDGSLGQEQILDYLSYSTRVYQLLSSHDVRSVYFYDREYRRLQHTHRFRWGTDIPHIQTVFLKPQALSSATNNTVQNSRPRNSTSLPPRASHTPQGVEICKRFNSRKGCFVKLCKFAHVCSVPGCALKHTAFDHGIPKNA